jgi:hypothetical protein
MLVVLLVDAAPAASQPFDSPLPTPTATLPPELSPQAKIALEHIAKREGVAVTALMIDHEHPRNYSLLGRNFVAFTIFNTRNGQVYQMLVDIKSDEVIDDLSALEKANADAYLAKYGKLDPALYDRLQTVADDTELPVALWVLSNYESNQDKIYATLAAKYPEVQEALARNASPFDVADPALSEQIRKEYEERLRQEVESSRQALVTHLQEQQIVFEVHELLPSITVTAFKKKVLELAQREDVQMLYLVENKG